jgi:hypothetical protein
MSFSSFKSTSYCHYCVGEMHRLLFLTVLVVCETLHLTSIFAIVIFYFLDFISVQIQYSYELFSF